MIICVFHTIVFFVVPMSTNVIPAEFPFISYYVINTAQTDPNVFYSGMRNSSLTKFEPKVIR